MLKNFEESLRIREYERADFRRLHAIDRECFPPGIAYSRAELLFYLMHRDSITRIAEWDGKIVGFAVGRIENEGCAHILTMDVIREARRQGVGTALMSSLHEQFDRRKIRMIFLEVEVDNTGAQRFYDRLDYHRVETVPGYYNGRTDAYRMVRLQP